MRAETADAKARTPEVPGGDYLGEGQGRESEVETRASSQPGTGMKREAHEVEEPNALAHPSVPEKGSPKGQRGPRTV